MAMIQGPRNAGKSLRHSIRPSPMRASRIPTILTRRQAYLPRQKL